MDGQSYKIVGRLEFDVDGGDNERLTMWIDPASESDPADMVNTTGDLGWTQVEYVALSAINYDGLPIISLADNVIVATTFDLAIGIAPPSFDLVIKEIKYAADDDEVTLTWSSRPDESYTVKYSLDMIDWSGDLDDSVPADDGDSTTRSFDLIAAGLEADDNLFFRVEKD